MEKQYELITPTDFIIDYYNDLWMNDKRIDEKIQLFDKGDAMAVGYLLFPNSFESNGEKDDSIIKAFNNNQSKEFLSCINETYSTQLRIKSDKWNDNRWSINEIKKYSKQKDIDAFIQVCKKITNKNTYSFATKVFSFTDRSRYPILDSISVALLKRYYERFLNKPIKKNEWGNYNDYVKDYTELLDTLKREKLIANDTDFKRFDIFLWLYGKAIEKYWEKVGVINFNNERVTYKPKNETIKKDAPQTVNNKEEMI